MSEFSELKNKTKLYNAEYAKLKKHMDDNYPGWEKEKDATHVKMRLNQAVKNLTRQKSKIIKKSQYIGIGDWPFVSDQVTIIKTGKLFVTCKINGKEYALNGLAKDAMPWLEFVHDAKKAIVGKDIGPFIEIGKRL